MIVGRITFCVIRQLMLRTDKMLFCRLANEASRPTLGISCRSGHVVCDPTTNIMGLNMSDKQPEKTNDVKVAEPKSAANSATKIAEQLGLEHPNYQQLEQKLTEAENKAQEYKDGWLRAQAEMENLKRRAERDVTNAHKYALEKFAYELLHVVDNLERSLQVKIADKPDLKDFYTGIELTLKLFLETLQKFQIMPINPEIGETFTPEKHTAIMTKEDPNAKSHTVLEVVQKGYWLKDRLLRPALVVVAK
jgi:molecular chaperone GrpE